MPPLVFKPLGRENVLVNPFTVSKHQALTFTSGGNADSNSFSIASAIDFSDPNSFSPNTAVTNSDGTYQSLLFKSVEHVFYTSGALSGSADFAAGGSGIRDFPLSGSVYVVNIPQTKFGEGIRPGTFELSTTGTASIVDDTFGKLVLSGTMTIVGNLFYDLGIAVINRVTTSLGLESIYSTGIFVGSASSWDLTIGATQTIYEYQVIATVEPYEFNTSMNPSATGFLATGSTGNSASVQVVDQMLSGTLSPYITTIGLYNDRYELVAIGKLPNPIKRLSKTQQSFIIRWDM